MLPKNPKCTYFNNEVKKQQHSLYFTFAAQSSVNKRPNAWNKIT